MSREKLLSTLDKSKHITKNLSKNGLKEIARMQNLSLNELEQIKKMQNLSENKLKQIVKNRRIRNYKNMSKEDLLIALLKQNKSHIELLSKSEDNDVEIGETKKLFNKLRNNFSKEDIELIRKIFRYREEINKYLKKLEQKDSLTSKKNKRKNIIPGNYNRLQSI